MRFALLLLVLASTTARADDGWTDVPALVRSAIAPIDADLRACGSKLPKRIALIASRTKSGTTAVAMPMPQVGGRGFTKEERCLMDAIEKVALPALPAEIDRVVFGHTVTDTPASPDPAFDAWRDPAKTLATVVDTTRRAALAACDRKPRTARLVLDLSRGKTRIWLPAWQFHSPTGDGSTPAAEQRVKSCMTKAIRDWRAPVLPRDLGEIQLALAVKP